MAVVALSTLWFAMGRPRSAQRARAVAKTSGSAAAPPGSTSPFSPFTPTLAPTVAPAVVTTAAPAETQEAERTPQTEVGKLQLSVRDFRAAYGSNPVGNNAEVTSALLGENPRRAAFVERSEVKLNEQGEMLDRWGRPYFFHAITGTFMEVRSAGPDGVLFTADDIVGQ